MSALCWKKRAALLIAAWTIVAAPAVAHAASPFQGRTIGESAGVQIKPWHTTDDDLSAISQAGFGLVRWGISWETVEKTPGTYDWSASDAFFRRLKAAHLHSIVIIGGGNSLYTGTTYNHDRMTAQARQPLPPSSGKALTLFSKFAAAAAQRYRDEGVIWELWNEPDMLRFWPPSAAPDEYAAFASSACKAMKGANAAALVVGPASASMPNHFNPLKDDIFKALAASPAASCLDAFSAHDYRYASGQAVKTPESVQEDDQKAIARLRTLFPGRNVTLICSEWGYASPLVDPAQQAVYPVRAILSNLLGGVPMTVWYEWKDSARTPRDPEGNYGLRTYDGSGKAGLQGVQGVLPRLRDARLVSRVPSEFPDVYAVMVSHADGRLGLVYWSSDDKRHQLQIGGGPRLPVSSTPAYADVPDKSAKITVG